MSEQVYKEIFKRPNKMSSAYNHFDISVVNQMHQIDVLHLPNDDGYPFVLSVIDCASRYKAARAIQGQTKPEIIEALNSIYSITDDVQESNNIDTQIQPVEPAKPKKVKIAVPESTRVTRSKGPAKLSPVEIVKAKRAKPVIPESNRVLRSKTKGSGFTKAQCMKLPMRLNGDGGFRMLGDWCDRHSIILIINQPRHHCAFVESMNKELAKLMFQRRHLEEIKEGEEVYMDWVQYLQKDVKKLNSRVTRMIKMKPVDAYKLDIVEQPENNIEFLEAKDLPIGTKVRRLLNKDEILTVGTNSLKAEKGVDKTRRRATDPYWTLDVYTVSDKFKEDGKYTMYEITDKNGDVYSHYYTKFALQKTKSS